MRALGVLGALLLVAMSAAGPGSDPPGAPAPTPAVVAPTARAGEPIASLATELLATNPGGRLGQVVDGLRFVHHARWDVDPAAATVRVRHELQLTNTAPDRSVPGGIEFTYFPEALFPVPVGATGLSAVGQDGRALPVRLDPSDSPFVSFAVVDLVPDLRYGRTQDIVVTYELVSTGPRSTSPVRVNGAYVGFPLLMVGDPGATSVEVRVPEPFEVEVVGDPLEERAEGDTVVLSAELADPDAWFTSIVARNDDALLSTEVDLGEHGVVVRAWPDDPGWADFAVSAVTDGVPLLEALIGLPWPADRTIEVLETAAPYEYGYAGWYQPMEGVIEVGDELDGSVMLHELTHLWFNSSLFRERWINEGLAEVFTAAVGGEMGLPEERPEPIDPEAEGAVLLNDWDAPDLTQEIAAEQEAYGYNAAWSVMDALATEVGIETLAEVVGAAASREPAYPGPGTEELGGTFAWTHLLDLLEDRAGSTIAVDLFSLHVATPGQQERLADRAASRARYVELEALSEPWATPAGVRRSMAAWRFSEADKLMADTATVLEVRDRAEPVLARAGVELDALGRAVEEAEGLGAVLDDMPELSHAIDALEEALDATDRSVGPVASVGLLFTSVDQHVDDAGRALAEGDYDRSVAASSRAVDLVEGATRAGVLRLVGLVLVVALLIVAALVLRRRRVPAPSEAELRSA